MRKILFVYDHNQPERLKDDGLWRALDILEKDYEIERYNIADGLDWGEYDFILGWGAFSSKVDEFIRPLGVKKGICLAAQLPINETANNYDMVFYETEYIRHWLEAEGLTKLTHAFGINRDVFWDFGSNYIGWDIISVGSFSIWHRQEKLLGLKGSRLAVGYLQRDNMQESASLAISCLLDGWMISDWVSAERLAMLYNMSGKLVATADFGQERAVLEARSCGIRVEVPDDNPKLKELLSTPIWDVTYYASQLKKGIESCF